MTGGRGHPFRAAKAWEIPSGPGCPGPPTMADAMAVAGRPGRPNSGLSGRIPLKNADLPAIDHPGTQSIIPKGDGNS